MQYLLIPGYGDSGPSHWQSLWQTELQASRVVQHNWLAPVKADWVATLDAQMPAATDEVVVIAHSLGCLTIGHWLAEHGKLLKALLLVAPADPRGAAFPNSIRGFDTLPAATINCPALLVGSSNDPYGSEAFARQLATDWGCDFHLAGALGHINADSRIGHWPEGMALLRHLLR